MSYETTEVRVEKLEILFGRFMAEMAEVNRHADERNRAADERNRAAEERMARFEGEMREFKAEMQVFKDEMQAFKDEMRAFKDEMRADRKEMNRQWGSLANKMGTVIEDILAPNLRRLASEHFGIPAILDFGIRRERARPDKPSEKNEFDTLVVGAEAVILGEAKSSPTVEHAEAFAGKGREFSEYFPEYRGRRLILVFGSWSIPAQVVRRLTALGIHAMQMGDETMELVNATELEQMARS